MADAPPWRYSICNELFDGWPLGRVAAYVADLGYQGLELAPYTLADTVYEISPEQRARLRADVEAAGICVVGLHWLLARTESLHLTAPEPTVRERTVRYLLEEVALCADLGGSVLVLGSPAQRNPPPGGSAAQAWDWTVSAMRRCGQRAAECGVVLCIEALPGPDCRFITTVDEAARLVREVDHPGFRLMVDVKAMAHDPRPIPEQIRLVAPLVRHMHANDPNTRGPGMGDVRFCPILRALRDVGYGGWISVEAFDAAYGIERLAQESMANLRAAEIEGGDS